MFHKHPLLFIFLGLLALTTLAVRAGSSPELSDTGGLQTLHPPRAQSAPLRIESLDAASSQAPLRGSPSGVIGPARIEADENGNLFVVDEGKSEQISEYGADGSLVQVFRGAGVPSIKSVADIAALPGTVIVADILGKALHYYNRSERTWRTIADSREPLRIEPVGRKDDGLLVMRIGKRWPFDLVAAGGVTTASFGDLLVDQQVNSLALDGYLARAGDSVVFAGKYLALLVSYTDKGSLNWTAQTIVEPERATVVTAGDRRWVSHGPMLASQALAANPSAVCVLSRRIAGIAIRYFIDIYRPGDGAYVKTLRLPVNTKWTSITIGGGHLFAASNRHIYKWPIDVLVDQVAESLLSAGQSIVNLDTEK